MRLTYPLLVNAKSQTKSYKIRDRDSMIYRCRSQVRRCGNLTTGWMARIAVTPSADFPISLSRTLVNFVTLLPTLSRPGFIRRHTKHIFNSGTLPITKTRSGQCARNG